MTKKKLKSTVKSTEPVKSTVDELLESLSPKERKEFKEELQDLALSEIILALMARDAVSVRKLAKMADLSPSVVQAMRSGSKTDFSMQSFFKILNGLGCNKLLIEVKGDIIPFDIRQATKK